MTDEKAIDLLRRMQEPEAYEPQITEEAFEALELAIRALGTDKNVGTTDVPDIYVGELISKEQAIDALRGYLVGKRCPDDGTLTCRLIENEVINKLTPTQPKRGKWHYKGGKPATIGLSFGVVCDNCGTESEYCTNFCGECGADMREVTT